MTSSRKTALVVGVLFILTFITSIGAAFAYGPVLTDPHYITGAGADTRHDIVAAVGSRSEDGACSQLLRKLLKDRGPRLGRESVERIVLRDVSHRDAVVVEFRTGADQQRMDRLAE